MNFQIGPVPILRIFYETRTSSDALFFFFYLEKSCQDQLKTTLYINVLRNRQGVLVNWLIAKVNFDTQNFEGDPNFIRKLAPISKLTLKFKEQWMSYYSSYFFSSAMSSWKQKLPLYLFLSFIMQALDLSPDEISFMGFHSLPNNTITVVNVLPIPADYREAII